MQIIRTNDRVHCVISYYKRDHASRNKQKKTLNFSPYKCLHPRNNGCTPLLYAIDGLLIFTSFYCTLVFCLICRIQS